MRGAWQEYDTTLVEQEDGSIAPAAVPDGVVLAGEVEGSSAEPAPVAEVAAGEDASVAVAWEGSLPAPVLERSAATYAGAWPGIDLVVHATRDCIIRSLLDTGGFRPLLHPFYTLKCDEPEKPRSYALLRRRVTDWPTPSGRPQRADDEGNLERKTKQPLPIRVEAEAVTFVPPLRHIAREDCYEEGCDHTANHALPSSTEKGRAECDFSDAGSKDGRVFADRDPGRHLCAELFTSGCQVGNTGVGKG